ncbi:pyridoxal phosphate-dependent aminotransferase [Anaerotignum sp. MSJ-24]|uniref:pyridoxal phosphate-dependent aminotransferase n=1 Tax=Anaerotignum sp. MSJ-24 TaxID=2841521 RepID=UPI001C10CA73|nr:pyridoxal phosphate-dependent aminotransferase [Anaerotignum sp. MSJ-24]MBU5464346.1 pyridoxal phosphate-dependent aminotransferase [Anaerotignum sp. MSJ-24]
MTENDLTPDYIAERVERLQGESAFAILSKANELEAKGMNVIHLEIGQPDFKTPENIIDAAKEAMSDGYTGYGPTLGYNELREAVADYVKEYKNIDATKDNVVIVPGGKPTMFFTMLTLVEPGDEVIYPNPGFPIYESCIKFARGIPVPMPLTADNDFRPDVEKLKSLITPKTKLIIINNPGNPTGGIFEKEDILAIADILKDRPDIFVLSDEIYDRLMYDGETISIASIPEMRDRTLVLDGFSKTYAMTGWRIGYCVANVDIIKKFEMIMVNSVSCTCSFTQMAAVEALKGPQYSVVEMKNKFKERRDWLVNALNEIDGIKCCMPRGAFYAFPDISSFGLSSKEFADRLLEEEGIALAWGTSFGEYGEGHIRISYATSLENLKEAVERLKRFTLKLKNEKA